MLRETEVLVVGAGPGGIAAATAAANAGCRVTLLDDNPRTGGQIWRRGATTVEPGETSEDRRRNRAIAALHKSGAEVLHLHRVFASSQPSTLDALHEPGNAPAHIVRFRYRKLILATGARECFLPFPGWTLPGVFGAGGLQAMVAGGFPVRGKRILVAGSGPLLLAVAAHLQTFGASVVSVAEQAPLRRLIPFTTGLLRSPGKIWQGLRYRLSLRKTPYHTGCWPIKVLPHASLPQLRAVQLTDGKRTWEEACDFLACGFHLVPNTELPQLLGCALDGAFVKVSAQQESSQPNVFCVGEPTGIAGLDAALHQGEIAGRACAGLGSPRLAAKARRERDFGLRLGRAFTLRPELRSLPRPDTIVCRCEDIPFSSFANRSGWTDAKLQSRCGMGPCQARVCGPAVHFLLGWKNASVRPPLFPVPLYALTAPDPPLEETA